MKIKSFLLAALVLPYTAHAQIAVWMSANDVESSSVSGIATEDFSVYAHNTTLPTTALGNNATYAAPTTTTVRNNDNFGGTSTGRYLRGASGTSTILTLAAPVAYFGIYLTAADQFNDIIITPVGGAPFTFDTTTLLNRLNGSPTVLALDGSSYQSSNYFGKPGGTTNASQAYAYLHFIADAGVTFDKIELKQRVGTAAFESDNHSTRVSAPTVPGSFVNIPEPSSLLLSLSTLGSLMLVRKRK